MGSSPESPPSLECFDLTRDPNVLEPGSEEWKLMGRRLIEALETSGGVVVEYLSDEVNGELLFDETFSAVRDLFDLPFETKLEITKSYPRYPNVLANDYLPYYQALGLANPVKLEEVRAFTQVIWPHGNDKFSNTINAISRKLHKLLSTILEMISDSYGVRNHYISQMSSTDESFRMSKYAAPMKDEPVIALSPHVDPTLLTVLCQNTVAGLQLKSKEGDHSFAVEPPTKGSFVILVGQALEAWSNGRLFAPRHHVTVSGVEDRFSCGFFLRPKEDQVIEAPRELVDEEHPPLFKPFIYKSLIEYNQENKAYKNSLQMYAGI